MKNKLLFLITACITACIMCFAFSGCGENDETAIPEGPTAVCSNGQFVGIESDGITAFKGIPYAKAPVGDLRWKAPEAPEDSEKVFDATEFGKSSVQYQWHSEPITTKVSEDCLTLNVWTTDMETADKPILFFIHGGGFAWGGTSEPLYNGEYIVREHPDAVVITTNYRLGMYGQIDFSKVEGGENFPDSSYLSILDLIQSLKWVQQNAEAFGGDPDNVTIFGESAGGAYVSLLMSCKDTEGLFSKAIAQSGSVNLTYSQDEFDSWGLTEALMSATGAKNMDDLMAIPEDELIEIYTSYDDEGNCLNDIYNMPRRGGTSPIPEDPYQAIADGANKDVIFITGTNFDEWRYWVDEMGDDTIVGSDDEETIQSNLDLYKEYIAKDHFDTAMAAASDADKANLNKLIDICDESEEIWQWTEVANETGFRMPSIVCAENHAKAGGTSYMYYFGKKWDCFDWMGACHASELSYIFHNLVDEGFSGTMDEALADHMCKAWVNFAKTGDPSTNFAEWTTYNDNERNTMVIEDDGSMKMVSDPEGDQRELMQNFAYYYLK